MSLPRTELDKVGILLKITLLSRRRKKTGRIPHFTEVANAHHGAELFVCQREIIEWTTSEKLSPRIHEAMPTSLVEESVISAKRTAGAGSDANASYGDAPLRILFEV